MAAGHEGEGHLKSLDGVVILQGNQLVGSISEEVKDLRVDTCDFFDGVSRSCFDDVIWLRDTNLGKVYSCPLSNDLECVLLLHGPEGDAGSSLASPCSSS